MPASKAAQRAVNKYVKENYDRLNITLAKGERDSIKAYAIAHGESVNSFIKRAIAEAMGRDCGQAAPAVSESVMPPQREQTVEWEPIGAVPPEPGKVVQGGPPASRYTYRTPAGTTMDMLCCRVKTEQAEAFQAFCAENGETINEALKCYVIMCIDQEG